MTGVPQTDLMLGRTIDGKYRIEKKLGAGAMGTVYRGVDAQGAPCAVKVLSTEGVADPDLRERFRREAEALLMLKHPNVLDVRDYGVDQTLGLPYLVMELLVGRTLEEMVVEHTPDPQTGLELATQVCRGLAFAHTNGVLHRDLKTENVFVIWDGQRWVAKLLDFGLVKLDDSKWGPAKKLTMQGAVFGSPAYMSPEQGTGSPMDARSDVYSMGIVLFEMLTGSWPYDADSQMAMLRAHLLEPIPPLSSKREGLVVRPELQAIVTKATAKKPAERFASAAEMLAALEAVPQPSAWISGMTNVPPAPIAPAPSAAAQPSPPQPPLMIAAPMAPAARSGAGPALIIAFAVGALLLLTVVGGVVAWLAMAPG